MAAIYNAQGGKKDGGMFTPADIFPSLSDAEPSRSEQPEAEPDDLAIARSIMAFGQRGRNLYRAGLGLPPTG